MVGPRDGPSSVEVVHSAPTPTPTTDEDDHRPAVFVQEDISQRVSRSLNSIDEEELLLKMSGSAGSQGQRRGGGIRREKGRRRRGDVDMIKEMRAQQLATKRTMTWSEIFSNWFNNVATYIDQKVLPGRLSIILMGSFIVGVMFIALIAAAIAAIVG